MNESNIETGVFPHNDVRLVSVGETVRPRAVLILLHGRGASAENIINAIDIDSIPSDVLVLAPQANNLVWFPLPFYESIVQNEPNVSSALKVVDALVNKVMSDYGLGTADIALAGFSQGASLVSQYLVTRPKQYKGACIFSGALMGSEAELLALTSANSLLQTPVYCGCDIADPHVPLSRFKQTESTLLRFGANVNYNEYKNLRHAIHQEGKRYLHSVLKLK